MSAADIITEALFATMSGRPRTADLTDRNLSLYRDLNADELDRVTLAVELEDKLGVDISDDAMSRIDTIGDVHDLVDRLQKIRRVA